MRHPLTWSETLQIPVQRPVTAAEVLGRVARVLNAESARDIRRTETGLSFGVGLGPSLRGWSPLYGISAGNVEVTAHPSSLEVRYPLGFGRIAVIATRMAGFVSFQVYAGVGPAPVPPATLLAGWAMLVGGNVGVALMRFPGFLRKAAESAPQGEAVSRAMGFGG